MTHRVAVVLLATATLACRDAHFEAVPPTPAAIAAAESLPDVPDSRLELPVRYDLAPALAWLEGEVPRTIGEIDKRLAIPGNDRAHFAFQIEREKFRLAFRDGALLSAVLHYQGRGWYNPPVLPEVSASCGTGDDQPRARVTLHVRGRIDSNWTLRPRSTVSADPLTDTERDECKVTVLQIDVTGKVLGAAEQALQKEVAKVDRRIRAFPLRKLVEGVWVDMQQPLRLTDSLWLLINPKAVRFLPPSTTGDTLIWQAGLQANPRIVGGARPAPTANPLLPPDRSPAPSPELLILSEGRLPYDVAEAILTKATAKTKIKIGERVIRIRHLKPIPLGDGQLAVALTVDGAAEGTLYAVGRPQIDSMGRLTMPDLTVDAGTTGALTGALAWLASTDRVEQYLREAITVNLAPTIEKARVLAEKNMNRELAPGLGVRATLASAKPIGVWAAPDALVARVIVRGEGELVISLRPPGPDSTGGGN